MEVVFLKCKLKGYVDVVVKRDGKIVYEDKGENTWVVDGVQQVIAWLIGRTAGAPAYIGIGTGSTAATSNQSALVSELDYLKYVQGGGRVAASKTAVKTNFTSDTAQFEATFTFIASGVTIYETGTFNAATGGVMFSRRTIGGFTPAINDQMTITWKLGLTI